MTQILVSPAEPPLVRGYFTSSSVPENLGVDFLFSNGETMVGIQRKAFPSDFLASIRDDRIAKELGQMETLGAKILILEGTPRWIDDGQEQVLYGQHTRFTKSQLDSMTISLQHMHGVAVYWTESQEETVKLVKRIAGWFENSKGKTPETSSLRKRNSPPKNEWGERGSKDWCIWIMQSFPGVGPKVARAIYDHFKYLPMTWTVTEDELLEVPGVGKKIAKALIETLDNSEVVK